MSDYTIKTKIGEYVDNAGDKRPKYRMLRPSNTANLTKKQQEAGVAPQRTDNLQWWLSFSDAKSKRSGMMIADGDLEATFALTKPAKDAIAKARKAFAEGAHFVFGNRVDNAKPEPVAASGMADASAKLAAHKAGDDDPMEGKFRRSQWEQLAKEHDMTVEQVKEIVNS